MNTANYYRGVNRGWKLATAYATGTRAQRRVIRARLVVLRESFSQFTRGMWDGFGDFAESRAENILAGVAPRTINPHRLRRVLERVGSEF